MMSRNYEIKELVGSGNFGNVYLVRCKKTGNDYVLKEVRINNMSPSERKQALTEADVLKRCSHKNIIRYKEASLEKERGLLCIVMEYAECGDMYAAIKRQQGAYFKETDTMSWFIQITLALQYIHHRNILHRDLKTQNIFLTANKRIKIGDFGISRVLNAHTDFATTITGTPYYLSPEICMRKPYNCKSDIWALGCVLFELTALTHPFQGKSFPEVVHAILKVKYGEIPSHTGPLIEDLIKIILVANPQERPSADEILAIPALQSHIYSCIESQTSPPPPQHNGSRRLSADDLLDFTPLLSFQKRNFCVPVEEKKTGKLRKIQFIPMQGKSKIPCGTNYKPSRLSLFKTPHQSKLPRKRRPTPDALPLSKVTEETKEVETRNEDITPKSRIARTYTLLKKAVEKSAMNRINKQAKTLVKNDSINSKTFQSPRHDTHLVDGAHALEEISNTSPQSPNMIDNNYEDDVLITSQEQESLKKCDADIRKNLCESNILDRSLCPHVSQCFYCTLSVLWKSRMSSNKASENEKFQLKDKLLMLFGKEKFEMIYNAMYTSWENKCAEENSLQKVLTMVNIDERQFLPLFIQLIQLTLFRRPASVSF